MSSSTYLDDQDAKLVYSLTGLHIHRAKSITRSKHLHPTLMLEPDPGISSRAGRDQQEICPVLFGAHIQEPCVASSSSTALSDTKNAVRAQYCLKH